MLRVCYTPLYCCVVRARTVTRGVNRGARVDLVGAMEKQIKRCDEPLETILRTFFVQENLSIDIS